ncbi:MAG: histidinol-phosphatase [Dehalococcoidia bacterium]|nr:histidinol-phosphatase [Dehalococcoidia bacterium]
MLIDYHIHPDFSLDGKGSIADYCRRALAIGMAEVCFTTHYDHDPQRSENVVRVRGQLVPVKSDWLDTYLEEIAAARQKFPALYIGAGLEIDYYPEMEEEIGRMLSGRPFDFVLGAVHCLNHLPISRQAEAQVYFAGRSAREVCRSYFRVASLAVQSGLFDCIAHLDLFKRFGRAYYGPSLSEAVGGLAEPVLEEIARRNIALELNTGGWRHSCRESYPGLDLLAMAFECGVSLITIGSDAHAVSQLASSIGKAVIIAEEAGYSDFVTYRERKPLSRPLAVLKDGRGGKG